MLPLPAPTDERGVTHLEQMTASLALEGLNPKVSLTRNRYTVVIPKEHAWRGIEDVFVGKTGESLLELVARIHETFLSRGIRANKEAA